MANKNRRKQIRLKNFDYSSPNNYFVTICTKNRENLFGDIQRREMVLNEVGRIAEKCWAEIPKHFPNIELDIFQIMPNHVHFILRILCRGVQLNAPTGKDVNHFSEISPKKNTLSIIIRTFKGAIKTICNQQGLHLEWQRGYYEHIIRNEKSYQKIYNYIISNSQTWKSDRNNPEYTKPLILDT